MSETHLVSAILEVLALEPGVVAYRNNVGAVRRRGHLVKYGLGTGSADIIACVAGKFVALEVKLPTEGATGEQIGWGCRLADARGVYHVVRTVEEARRAVRQAKEA